MEYRIVYNNTGIIQVTEHVETTITATLDTFFVGQIDEAIHFFRRKNIDYSMILEEFEIEEKVLITTPISSIFENDVEIQRRIDVVGMPILGDSITITLKIVREDAVDEVIVDEVVETRTYIIDNNKIVDNNIGEFDYFYDLVLNQNLPLKNVIIGKILEMDSEQKFDMPYVQV